MSESYYEDRKKDLEQDFNKLKEKTFAKFLQVSQEWSLEAQEIQNKFLELDKKQKKEVEEAEVKK